MIWLIYYMIFSVMIKLINSYKELMNILAKKVTKLELHTLLNI